MRGADPGLVYRHALATRVSHWLAAVCVLVLVMSGLQIFNAHPALYWGNRSDPDRALLRLKATEAPDGGTPTAVQDSRRHPPPSPRFAKLAPTLSITRTGRAGSSGHFG